MWILSAFILMQTFSNYVQRADINKNTKDIKKLQIFNWKLNE